MVQSMECDSLRLQEVKFVLRCQEKLKLLDEMGSVKPFLTEEVVHHILQNAERFSDGVPPFLHDPGATCSFDTDVTQSDALKAAYQKIFEEGWGSISVSQEHGGQGLPVLLQTALNEIFLAASVDVWRTANVSMHGIEMIAECCSVALKSLFIPRLISGEWSLALDRGALAASSRTASSSVHALSHEDGAYRLFGRSEYPMVAGHGLADNLFILVRACVQQTPLTAGEQALFLVPQYMVGPGGVRGVLNEIRIPIPCTVDADLVGRGGSVGCGENGNGAFAWKLASINEAGPSLARLRSAVALQSAMRAVATPKRDHRLACSEGTPTSAAGSQQQGQFVETVAAHESLLETAVIRSFQKDALRAAAYAFASAIDLAAGHPVKAVRQEQRDIVDLISPVIDFWGQFAEWDAAAGPSVLTCMPCGGASLRPSAIVLRSRRDVDWAAQELVEVRLVPDGGKAFRAWQHSVFETAHWLDLRPSGGLADIRTPLLAAAERLQCEVEWCLACFATNPQIVLDRSRHLLVLFAAVLGASELARLGLAAARLLSVDEGAENASFLKTKILSARHFAVYELPRATEQMPVLAQSA